MPFFSKQIPDKIKPDVSNLSLADLNQMKCDLISRKTRARAEISKNTNKLKALRITLKKEKNALLVFRDEAKIAENQRQSTLADILDNYSVDDYIIKMQLLNDSPYAICESKCKPVQDEINYLLSEKKRLQEMMLGLRKVFNKYRSQINSINEHIDNLSNAAGIECSL